MVYKIKTRIKNRVLLMERWCGVLNDGEVVWSVK
jgi:hypothetical protein